MTGAAASSAQAGIEQHADMLAAAEHLLIEAWHAGAYDPPSDIERELRGLKLSLPALRHLIGLGVPPRLIADLNAEYCIATAQVELSCDGSRWQLGGPDSRLLIGVKEEGELIDVAAIASHDRNQWALRRGEGWCLGHDQWRAAQQGLARELRLHSTPLDWLCSGGDGICVLDWSAYALSELRLLGERVLITADRGAGERLRQLLAYGGLPRVKETGGLRKAA